MTDKQPPRTITDLPESGSLFLDFLSSVYNGSPLVLELKDIYRANEIVLAARDAGDKRQMTRV